ncbi:MAG: hypothetical protein ACKO34_07450 [Vampirovibrionales bacterium]
MLASSDSPPLSLIPIKRYQVESQELVVCVSSTSPWQLGQWVHVHAQQGVQSLYQVTDYRSDSQAEQEIWCRLTPIQGSLITHPQQVSLVDTEAWWQQLIASLPAELQQGVKPLLPNDFPTLTLPLLPPHAPHTLLSSTQEEALLEATVTVALAWRNHHCLPLIIDHLGVFKQHQLPNIQPYTLGQDVFMLLEEVGVDALGEALIQHWPAPLQAQAWQEWLQLLSQLTQPLQTLEQVQRLVEAPKHVLWQRALDKLEEASVFAHHQGQRLIHPEALTNHAPTATAWVIDVSEQTPTSIGWLMQLLHAQRKKKPNLVSALPLLYVGHQAQWESLSVGALNDVQWQSILAPMPLTQHPQQASLYLHMDTHRQTCYLKGRLTDELPVLFLGAKAQETLALMTQSLPPNPTEQAQEPVIGPVVEPVIEPVMATVQAEEEPTLSASEATEIHRETSVDAYALTSSSEANQLIHQAVDSQAPWLKSLPESVQQQMLALLQQAVSATEFSASVVSTAEDDLAEDDLLVEASLPPHPCLPDHMVDDLSLFNVEEAPLEEVAETYEASFMELPLPEVPAPEVFHQTWVEEETPDSERYGFHTQGLSGALESTSHLEALAATDDVYLGDAGPLESALNEAFDPFATIVNPIEPVWPMTDEAAVVEATSRENDELASEVSLSDWDIPLPASEPSEPPFETLLFEAPSFEASTANDVLHQQLQHFPDETGLQGVLPQGAEQPPFNATVDIPTFPEFDVPSFDVPSFEVAPPSVALDDWSHEASSAVAWETPALPAVEEPQGVAMASPNFFEQPLVQLPDPEFPLFDDLPSWEAPSSLESPLPLASFEPPVSSEVTEPLPEAVWFDHSLPSLPPLPESPPLESFQFAPPSEADDPFSEWELPTALASDLPTFTPSEALSPESSFMPPLAPPLPASHPVSVELSPAPVVAPVATQPSQKTSQKESSKTTTSRNTPPSSPSRPMVVGGVVEHPQYGQGTVQSIADIEGRAIVSVLFEGVGKRLMDPTISRLKVVS